MFCRCILNLSSTLTNSFSRWVNLFESSCLITYQNMLPYYKERQINLLFFFVWIRLISVHLLLSWEVQQVHALALNFDACQMHLALQASCIRHIKISAHVHWIRFIFTCTCKVNMQLLTYNQIIICSKNKEIWEGGKKRYFRGVWLVTVMHMMNLVALELTWCQLPAVCLNEIRITVL